MGRFLNHSCDPNLEKVNVFVDSHDGRMPRCGLVLSCLDFTILTGLLFSRIRIFLLAQNYAMIMVMPKVMLKESIESVCVAVPIVEKICINASIACSL